MKGRALRPAMTMPDGRHAMPTMWLVVRPNRIVFAAGWIDKH
jgi:hypothetical protein